MAEPEFPLCAVDDPRVPVVYNMLRKSQLMGGNFTLDARRILAALDEWGTRRLEAALDVDDAQDEPVCWVESGPGSGVRCGLHVDHEGDHRFYLWQPLHEDARTGVSAESPESKERNPHA